MILSPPTTPVPSRRMAAPVISQNFRLGRFSRRLPVRRQQRHLHSHHLRFIDRRHHHQRQRNLFSGAKQSGPDHRHTSIRPAPGRVPYYRYETGTSMAAPMVSGTLALMQEFYAKAYGVRPSPAMLKAMLINGAQATGFYDYKVLNSINYEGWGLINLPDSLPPGVTNQLGASCSTYVQDQNPTNALATGDSQTYVCHHDQRAALTSDAGVDGSAGRPRRRHQAGEQSGSGRHQSQQPDQSDCLFWQRHLGLPAPSITPTAPTRRPFLTPSTTCKTSICR